MKEGSCPNRRCRVCVCAFLPPQIQKTPRSRQNNISSSDMRKCFSCNPPKMYARARIRVRVRKRLRLCVQSEQRTGREKIWPDTTLTHSTRYENAASRM